MSAVPSRQSPAEAAYDNARTEALALLERIRHLVESHQPAGSVNYAHVGDLSHTVQLLRQTELFLRS